MVEPLVSCGVRRWDEGGLTRCGAVGLFVSRTGRGKPGGLTTCGDGSGVTLRGEAGAGAVGGAATCWGTSAISDSMMVVPGLMGVGGTASGAKIS
jgi:hypothetical protein